MSLAWLKVYARLAVHRSVRGRFEAYRLSPGFVQRRQRLSDLGSGRRRRPSLRRRRNRRLRRSNRPPCAIMPSRNRISPTSLRRTLPRISRRRFSPTRGASTNSCKTVSSICPWTTRSRSRSKIIWTSPSHVTPSASPTPTSCEPKRAAPSSASIAVSYRTRPVAASAVWARLWDRAPVEPARARVAQAQVWAASSALRLAMARPSIATTRVVSSTIAVRPPRRPSATQCVSPEHRPGRM
jgi:hypothetical protein